MSKRSYSEDPSDIIATPEAKRHQLESGVETLLKAAASDDDNEVFASGLVHTDAVVEEPEEKKKARANFDRFIDYLSVKKETIESIKGYMEDKKQEFNDNMRECDCEIIIRNKEIKSCINEMAKNTVFLVHPDGQRDAVIANDAEIVELKLMIPKTNINVVDIREDADALEKWMEDPCVKHASDVISDFWAKYNDSEYVKAVEAKESAADLE